MNDNAKDRWIVQPIISLEMDVDDIFDQTDSATFEQEFSNRQYDKYVSKFYNEGYREALSDLEDKASTETSESENNVLQTAFDKGYNSAFLVSKKLATLSASVKTHLKIYKNISGSEVIQKKQQLENISVEIETTELRIKYFLKGYESTSKKEQYDTKLSTEQQIANHDEEWCSKFRHIVDLDDLQHRCVSLLDIDI